MLSAVSRSTGEAFGELALTIGASLSSKEDFSLSGFAATS
jgi:hypothetical protein